MFSINKAKVQDHKKRKIKFTHQSLNTDLFDLHLAEAAIHPVSVLMTICLATIEVSVMQSPVCADTHTPAS